MPTGGQGPLRVNHYYWTDESTVANSLNLRNTDLQRSILRKPETRMRRGAGPRYAARTPTRRDPALGQSSPELRRPSPAGAADDRVAAHHGRDAREDAATMRTIQRTIGSLEQGRVAQRNLYQPARSEEPEGTPHRTETRLARVTALEACRERASLQPPPIAHALCIELTEDEALHVPESPTHSEPPRAIETERRREIAAAIDADARSTPTRCG